MCMTSSFISFWETECYTPHTFHLASYSVNFWDYRMATMIFEVIITVLLPLSLLLSSKPQSFKPNNYPLSFDCRMFESDSSASPVSFMPLFRVGRIISHHSSSITHSWELYVYKDSACINNHIAMAGTGRRFTLLPYCYGLSLDFTDTVIATLRRLKR